MSKPQILVRVEKHGENKGNVFGLYADKGEAQGVDRKDGHFPFEESFFKATRPATAEEEQEFTAWYEPRYGLCDLVKRRF